MSSGRGGVVSDGGLHQYTYTGIQFQQQPNAPMMYLLAVDARDLLRWADVPNAKADYMAGYQRVFTEDRVVAITDFLVSDAKNIIPGAVIVTIDSAAVSVVQSGDADVVSLTLLVQDRPFEDRLNDLYEHFYSRLSDSERLNVPDASALDDENSGETTSDEPNVSGIPESYIATLTAELALARTNLTSLPPDRQEAIRNYVSSVSKPGLIIDGQHRVFGAKDVSQHNVRLPIVLIPGLDMGEQVFHFYVLNNKARPLTPTELRRTISTSLSNAEIDALWQRFDDAGVNPEATRWTHKMNTDPRSPFKDLVDFGLGGTGFIKENVAYQLVSKFVNMPRKYRSLYIDVPAWRNADDERLDYFFSFWSAIRNRYEDLWHESVQLQGGQLFYKAAMLVLQEFVLDFLSQYMNVRRVEGKPSPFMDLEDLQQLVQASLTYLPPEFFAREWQEKQLDTSDRRAFLRSQMEMAVRNQGKGLGYQKLFRKA
jgi:hypothetical protein